MQSESEIIRLFGTTEDSIVDGLGLRFVVFVQGCSHGCPGCHNLGSWPYDGGSAVRIDDLVREIQAKRLIDGVTFSGGEPLDQAESCLKIAKKLIAEAANLHNSLSLWLYTGYIFEDIVAGRVGLAAKELVALCDVVVDGLFIEELKTYDLQWCGSSNQRLIAAKDSLSLGKVVLWENQTTFPETPPSW